MSQKYDEYLIEHKTNVKNGFYFLKDYLPQIFGSGENSILGEVEHNIVYGHDSSKTELDEYDAYDAYFYGGNRSFQVISDFNRAWLKHIHRNPHHWQHWVLINDDKENGVILIDMPDVYIIEMICDWWSFSWSKGKLFEIFDWYDEHRLYMKMSDYTRGKVENILDLLKEKLNEINDSLEELIKQ